MYEDTSGVYDEEYTTGENISFTANTVAYYYSLSNPFFDFERSHPQFMIVKMPWFTPLPGFEFAVWYIINFYITVVGFVFEFLLFLAMFSNMLKKNSELRSYYYLLISIIGVFDMTRFFIPADYRFIPSLLFTKPVANTLRYTYIVYGFFMCIFVPLCQWTLTINRLTAVMLPLKHKKIWSKRNSAVMIVVVTALPIMVTIPYAFHQDGSQYRYIASFIPISVVRYLKIVILTGISLASIATLAGVAVLIRFFFVVAKSAKIAFELRLLIVIMISNVGCISYNICQIFLCKAYSDEALQSRFSGDYHAIDNVYFFDQLAKDILIFHHYMSFIMLTYMSSAVRRALVEFYPLDRILALASFKNFFGRVFHTSKGFSFKSNCTGTDREKALKCIEGVHYDIFDVDVLIYRFCKDIEKSTECFSKINNTECLASDVLTEKLDIHPLYPMLIEFLMSKNLCGKGSKQDLAQIGCLYRKSLYYAQQCGTMDLDNCEKRLKTVQCRMKYVQSECNTVTAMKICENYIIDGDHCVDILSQCRNMTFEQDKGTLTRGLEEYVSAFYSRFEEDITDYGGNFNKAQQKVTRNSTAIYPLSNSHFQHIIDCIVAFEKREEIPIRRFPIFFNMDIFPTDNRTLFNHCYAMEELFTCFGKKFIEECIKTYAAYEFLSERNEKFPFTTIAEQSLCPSKDNGVTLEALGCLLNVTRYMDMNYYECENYQSDRALSDEARIDIILCQLIAVYKKCGEPMSKALCKFFQSDFMFLFNLPKFNQNCNSYIKKTCTCFKIDHVW
ncbi:hypothetical protein FO519_007618 [Halicephalobus sp. NKZ332]|nr:hypothetical protein FO519_007618 [Halicephalobus sp. NKZ332]